MHHISMSMNKTFIRDNTNIVLLLENCGYCIASDEITTGGKLALVTYIRTDSTRVSEEADAAAREYVRSIIG